MNIRRATAGDAVALANVHIDFWRSAYRGLVPDSHLDSLDYDRRAARCCWALVVRQIQAHAEIPGQFSHPLVPQNYPFVKLDSVETVR